MMNLNIKKKWLVLVVLCVTICMEIMSQQKLSFTTLEQEDGEKEAI
jgi:hypothetical protein